MLLPSSSVERAYGAIATLNVGKPTLSMCFISYSPSCNYTWQVIYGHLKQEMLQKSQDSSYIKNNWENK
uniref:Uncharacterized protein LOC105108770 n=1 Tax=Rhizophora mucronata TaxID=61149 RepID=A0A2P2K141_RHIMU